MKYMIGEVVEDEDGELAVEIPIHLLSQMGWDEHTLLEWVVDEENKVYIKEAENAGDL